MTIATQHDVGIGLGLADEQQHALDDDGILLAQEPLQGRNSAVMSLPESPSKRNSGRKQRLQ